MNNEFDITKIIGKAKNLDTRIAEMWDQRDPETCFDKLSVILKDLEYMKEQLDGFMAHVCGAMEVETPEMY